MANKSRGLSESTKQSFEDAAKRIKEVARRLGRSTGTDLRAIAEEVLTDCKASAPGRGVPRDTGALAGTGRVDGPFDTDKGPVVEIGFGDSTVDYALMQHEILTYYHKVGEARYLVRALERWQPDGSAAMEALRNNYQEGMRLTAPGQKGV